MEALTKTAEVAITSAITNRDAPMLLKWYDNKGLISIAAKAKGSNNSKFVQWVVRALRNDAASGLSAALRGYLPPISPN